MKVTRFVFATVMIVAIIEAEASFFQKENTKNLKNLMKVDSSNKKAVRAAKFIIQQAIQKGKVPIVKRRNGYMGPFYLSGTQENVRGLVYSLSFNINPKRKVYNHIEQTIHCSADALWMIGKQRFVPLTDPQCQLFQFKKK